MPAQAGLFQHLSRVLCDGVFGCTPKGLTQVDLMALLFSDALFRKGIRIVIIDFIAGIGRQAMSLVQTLGAMTLFFAQGFLQIFSMPFQFFSIIQQVYYVGARSIPIIALTGAFSGMVLSLQAYYARAESGSEGLLGSTVGLSLIRELGPVLTALMITAGAGSAIAAEIGVMRISEQIDALTTMDISPVRFLISPDKLSLIDRLF